MRYNATTGVLQSWEIQFYYDPHHYNQLTFSKIQSTKMSYHYVLDERLTQDKNWASFGSEDLL